MMWFCDLTSKLGVLACIGYFQRYVWFVAEKICKCIDIAGVNLSVDVTGFLGPFSSILASTLQKVNFKISRKLSKTSPIKNNN